jgi:hypothetical protein
MRPNEQDHSGEAMTLKEWQRGWDELWDEARLRGRYSTATTYAAVPLDLWERMRAYPVKPQEQVAGIEEKR